eukprot:COSAG04_NODE_29334_length_269_cov_1.370588_1_plen_40_part_01
MAAHRRLASVCTHLTTAPTAKAVRSIITRAVDMIFIMNVS